MGKSSREVSTDHLPNHLFRLVEGLRRRMRAEVAVAFGPHPPFERPSFARMLQLIPPDGIRITDYATLARMTKQAVGEFVDSMETAELVVSERLPSDRRVRLVRRTALGDAVAADIDRVIGSVEARLRAEVGARRYDTMVAVMRELGADSFG